MKLYIFFLLCLFVSSCSFGGAGDKNPLEDTSNSIQETQQKGDTVESDILSQGNEENSSLEDTFLSDEEVTEVVKGVAPNRESDTFSESNLIPPYVLARNKFLEKLDEYNFYYTDLSSKKHLFNDAISNFLLDDALNVFTGMELKDLGNVQKSNQVFHLKDLSSLCQTFSWQDPREETGNPWDVDASRKYYIKSACERGIYTYEDIASIVENFGELEGFSKRYYDIEVGDPIISMQHSGEGMYLIQTLLDKQVDNLLVSIYPYRQGYILLHRHSNDNQNLGGWDVTYIFRKNLAIYEQILYGYVDDSNTIEDIMSENLKPILSIRENINIPLHSFMNVHWYACLKNEPEQECKISRNKSIDKIWLEVMLYKLQQDFLNINNKL